MAKPALSVKEARTEILYFMALCVLGGVYPNPSNELFRMGSILPGS
jgi:hypothetical protein